MPFFACYLLTPLQPPQRLRCTYVGFTVAPTRRIRQHNGELANGAKRTRKFRPWEMIAVVHGFPSKFRAVQFEWVWQHPHVSKITRTHLDFLRGSRGLGAPRSVKRKLIQVLEMVNLEPFKELNLTVSFTSEEMHNVARSLGARYSIAKCETRALETFAGVEKDAMLTSSKCFICEYELESESGEGEGGEQAVGCYCEGCEMCCHSACLMDHFRSMREEDDGDVEMSGECPECQQVLQWSLLTQHCGQETENRKRKGGGRRKRSKKRARVSTTNVDNAADAESSSILEPRPNAADVRPNDDGLDMEVASFGSSSSTCSFAEYNSDGWFENDGELGDESMTTDHAWNSGSPPNILDAQMPPQRKDDAEMIDLTED